MPAYQRLHPDHLVGSQLQLGLVIQFEFARVQTLQDAPPGLMQQAHALVVDGIVEVIAVLAGLLGDIHRLVGMAQQGIAVLVVGGIEGHPDTGRDGDRMPLDLHGRRNGLHDALQHLEAFGLKHQVVEQHHELVATQTRQGIARTQRLLQAARDIDQQLDRPPRARTGR